MKEKPYTKPIETTEDMQKVVEQMQKHIPKDHKPTYLVVDEETLDDIKSSQ